MTVRNSETAADFRFAGAITTTDFAAFAADRLRRLALSGAPRIEGDAVLCRVCGPPDLVDAFEMACLIGPAGSLVTEHERRPS